MNWLADYREYTECTESPRIMHLWTGIGSLVAVMRRNYCIPFGHIRMFPYVYTVLVGPPGIVQKSTTLGFSTRLLSKINGVELAPDATSPQKLIMCLEEASRNVVQADGNEVHHCLTVASSEFASIINGPDSETMITWLTDLFDREDRFAYQTKTQGSNEISNPWIQLMACTTPSSLQQCLPINTVGDGLTSRIVFVYADKKDQLISVPRAPKEALVNKLVSSLEEISTNMGLYTFSDDGLEWWDDFYRKTNEQWTPSDYRLIPYKARRHAHILKLAMVLAVSYGEKELSVRMLDKAHRIIKLTEINMHKAFGGMGENSSANHMIKIAAQLREQPMGFSDLYAKNFLDVDSEELSKVVEGLETAGVLKKKSFDGSIIYTIDKNTTSPIFSGTQDSTEIGNQAWDIITED